MSTNMNREELAQLIREVIKEDPSIVVDALREAKHQHDRQSAGIGAEDRAIADSIFTEYKEVFDALA